MWYLIGIIILCVVGILLLRLRVRLAVGNEDRIIFLSLGRTGPELDFIRRVGHFRLFGKVIKQFSLDAKKEKIEKPKPETIPSKKKKPVRPKRKKRTRSLRDSLRILPQCTTALGCFAAGIIRSGELEELSGEIHGGFDSPDMTGQAFGYYQALAGAIPPLGRNFSYYPDWTGASLSGTVTLAIALPMYQFVYRTVRLLLGLPVMKLTKLAIGTKKGGHDVK
jgi:hypothetical protein